MTDTSADTVEQILVEHRAVIEAGNAGLEHAIAAGKLLRVMRETVKKEKKIKWADWLEKNCPGISDRTDRLYRHLAEHERAILKAAGKDFGNGVAECSVRGAVKLIAKPRTSPRHKSPTAPASSPDPEQIIEALAADEVEDIISRKWDEEKRDVLRSKLGRPDDLETLLQDQTPAPEMLVLMLARAYKRNELLKLTEQLSDWLTKPDDAAEPGDGLDIPAALGRRGELPAAP
jgi:hypothetical protein